MISIQEALRRLYAQPISLKEHTSELQAALGYYLAEEIVAPFDMPPFDNSAMDGYAVCGTYDTYRITGKIAAGDTHEYEIKAGEAMRIFTGGKVPKGCTAVVMQEKTLTAGDQLQVLEPVANGANIRLRGAEIMAGKQVFPKGHQVSPATLGLIGSLGLSTVQVQTKPKVRLITTGDELITPGMDRKEGQIYESNSFAIAGALAQHGFSCAGKVSVPDDYDSTYQIIAEQLLQADVLLLSGGISVGEYDYVKQALEQNGVEEIFYKVIQKPGKPLYFGRQGDKFIFALPGNPASTLTCLYIYVLPLLQRLSGAIKTGLPRVGGRLAHDFEMKSDRPTFLKALLSDGKVSILEGQGSSMIHTMATGNALVLLAASGLFPAGTEVECILFG